MSYFIRIDRLVEKKKKKQTNKQTHKSISYYINSF